MWLPRALRAWLQRQFGVVNNLRLVWPQDWYQLGRDAPGAVAPELTFPAVFRAIDMISNDIARMPMRHWRWEDGRRSEVEDSWECGRLDKPNEYQTGFDLMKGLVSAQLLRGNGYLYALRNRRWQVDTLHGLFPDYVSVYRTGPDYFYQVSANELAEIDTARMVPARAMFHHRMAHFNDPLIGVTPMIAAAVSSQAGLAILRQSMRFFQRMARPSGLLQTAKALDRGKAEQIKERFQRIFAGEEGAGDVAVLEEGLQWQALTMTAVDSDLINQLRYTVEDVARVYGVPLFMLGDLTKATYSSAEQLAQLYLNQCLSAHMKALEWRFSQFFGMNVRREFLAFDTDELLRAELRTRIEALSRGVQGGILTPNEARRVDGRDPVEGGDQIFMQQQMVPVAQLASRTDLTQKPAMTAPPAQTPTREIAAPAIDREALREALRRAVFDKSLGSPPARPRIPYRASALALAHAERDGRELATYH